MKEHSNTLRNTIIGTVIGGLLLSFILWLIGFLPAVWGWLVKVLASIQGWLTSIVAIPVWLVVVAIMLMVPTFVRMYQYYRMKNQATEHQAGEAEQERAEPEEQFNDLEMKILRVLSQADGERMTISDISVRANESQIRTQYALDTLNEKGLLYQSLNYVYGTGYFLNRNGRQRVIKLGMA